MMLQYVKIVVLFSYCFVMVFMDPICPLKCICTKVIKKGIDENIDGLKVKCGGTPTNKIISLKEIDFSAIELDVVYLDLSKNQITNIEYDFVNMTSLRKLDLSNNAIVHIDESMFGDILSLERLKLAQNNIVHIFQGSLEQLKQLKTLDISMNPLACDCELMWLSSWSDNSSVRLLPTPKCSTPAPFKNMSLKKLRIGVDLHCESPFQPILELIPSNDQVIFEGDSLTLRCRAPRLAIGDIREYEELPAKSNLFWGWSNDISSYEKEIRILDPQKQFPSIIINDHHLSDSGLLDSILIIPHITQAHSGLFDCRLKSQMKSKNIKVIVITEKTKYCPAIDTNDNKGSYSWPKTMIKKLVRLPCQSSTNTFASYMCNENGLWVNLNTSFCPFVNEITKILEQYSKVNLTISKGNILESVRHLNNLTAIHDSKMNDPMDLVFIAKTVENYLEFLRQEKDLGSILLEIISNVLKIPGHLFPEAQKINASCTKIINAAETIVNYIPISQASKHNIAMELFKIRTDNSYTGLTCSWFNSVENNIFQCTIGHQMSLYDRVDVSLQLPTSLFIQHPENRTTTIQKLLLTVFENANLFPLNSTEMKITSKIISAKVLQLNDKVEIHNLTEPVFVVLKPWPYHNQISSPKPAVWDSISGKWVTEHCNSQSMINGMLVFTCNRLGVYGLLQNIKYLNDFSEDDKAGAKFRFSPYGVYVGSAILFVFSWINIVTYIVYGHTHILMNKRKKHSLINTFASISMLSLIFAIGIYQTENYRVCQIIGIIVHYLSLSILLWLCVLVCNLYNIVTRRNDRIGSQEENRIASSSIRSTGNEPKEKKPILGIYLIGYGISFIICGISSVVNLKEYASYSFCFIDSGNALNSVFVPSCILLGLLLILLVCIKFNLKSSRHTISAHISDDTQQTDHVDLQLLENNQQVNQYRSYSIKSSPTNSSNMDDLEHTTKTQWRAYIILLILLICTWALAALCVVKPFNDKILYEEEIFSILYAVSASILGLFILFFFGIARSDFRSVWSKTVYCVNNRDTNFICHSKVVSNNLHNTEPAHQNVTTITPSIVYHQTVASTLSHSNSSQCSKNRAIPNGNAFATATTLNRPENDKNAFAQRYGSDVGGGTSHRVNTAEMFYNPNQSNVARKFFKKQRKLQKHNNIEIIKQNRKFDDHMNDAASDISSTYLGFRTQHGSNKNNKINNTNIHVDKKNMEIIFKETRQMTVHPNILSDSCNESDLFLDMVAEERVLFSTLKNKVNNDLIANIYTNIPETQKPEHETVTMRIEDKNLKAASRENDLDKPSSRRSSSLPPIYANTNFLNGEKKLEQDFCLPNKSTLHEIIPTSRNSDCIAAASQQLTKQIHIDDSSSHSDIFKVEALKEYVSSTMDLPNISMTDSVNFNRSMKEKSKSLISLKDITQYQSVFNHHHMKSISLNDIIDYSTTIDNNLDSPVFLPPPALCDIEDSPDVSQQQLTYHIPDNTPNYTITANSTYINNHPLSLDMVKEDEELSSIIEPGPSHIRPMERLMSSPTTSFSDINYQNSEISSQDYYAPHSENDLDMMIAERDNINFEISDDEVDELYQMIKGIDRKPLKYEQNSKTRIKNRRPMNSNDFF